MRNPIIPVTALTGALFSVFLFGTQAAHADLKVVNDVTLTGLPAGAAGAPMPDLSKPLTSTIYYKADKIRTESGGTVTIVSGGTDSKTWMLNPVAKTYYLAPADTDPTANPFAAMLQFHATGKVLKTLEKKDILGKDSSKYSFDMQMKMTLSIGDPSMSDQLPTIGITGAEWTTSAVAVPVSVGGLSSGMMGKLMQGPMTGGLKEMTKQMGEIKGFPLLTTMTMTFKFPEGSQLESAIGDQVPKKMTVRTEVKSLSEDALSDDLFTVPADYTKVDAPAPPALPTLPAGAPTP